jgi:hypothetical protein
MLRTRRIVQLQTALCLWAFLSAYIAFVFHRILEAVALPRVMTNLASGIAGLQEIDTVKKVCVLVVEGSVDVRDNGAFLAALGLGFVMALSVIVCATAGLLYRELQRSKDSRETSETENTVDLALSGRLALWKTFWGFYVGVSLLSALAINGAASLLMKHGAFEDSRWLNFVAMPVAMAIPLTLSFISAYAVWRCAPNTERAVWRYLARIAVVLFSGVPVIQSLGAFGFILAH